MQSAIKIKPSKGLEIWENIDDRKVFNKEYSGVQKFIDSLAGKPGACSANAVQSLIWNVQEPLGESFTRLDHRCRECKPVGGISNDLRTKPGSYLFHCDPLPPLTSSLKVPAGRSSKLIVFSLIGKAPHLKLFFCNTDLMRESCHLG